MSTERAKPGASNRIQTDSHPGGLRAGFTPLGIWAFSVGTSIGWGSLVVTNNAYLGQAGPLGSVLGMITGAVIMILVGLVVVGGLKRIAAVTEKIVPFMVILYMIGTIAIFFINIGHVGAVFTAIFKGAFGTQAAAGGIVFV